MKDIKKVYFLFIRYIIIFLAGLGGGLIFYKIFLFPTVFLSAKLLSFFGEAYFIKDFIIFSDIPIEISKSCVAAAAYYFFFILILSMELKAKDYFKLLFFNFGVFLLVNVVRIFFMAFLIEKSFFDSVHMLVWNFFSTIFVVLIWFSSVKLFNIKKIPGYDDFVFLKSLIKTKKRKNSIRSHQNNNSGY
ncbi:MAG: pacearchaeosortase [Candidatus Pacearchaeota archaeon]